jgi:hypothetical protein
MTLLRDTDFVGRPRRVDRARICTSGHRPMMEHPPLTAPIITDCERIWAR